MEELRVKAEQIGVMLTINSWSSSTPIIIV